MRPPYKTIADLWHERLERRARLEKAAKLLSLLIPFALAYAIHLTW